MDREKVINVDTDLENVASNAIYPSDNLLNQPQTDYDATNRLIGTYGRNGKRSEGGRRSKEDRSRTYKYYTYRM